MTYPYTNNPNFKNFIKSTSVVHTILRFSSTQSLINFNYLPKPPICYSPGNCQNPLIIHYSYQGHANNLLCTSQMISQGSKIFNLIFSMLKGLIYPNNDLSFVEFWFCVAAFRKHFSVLFVLKFLQHLLILPLMVPLMESFLS